MFFAAPVNNGVALVQVGTGLPDRPSELPDATLSNQGVAKTIPPLQFDWWGDNLSHFRGAQWKQAGRVANATKRGALIGKLVKEILVAAKLGDPHPENNPRLWVAVEAAKKQSVPRDTIDRAIKKGAGLLDEKVVYDLVTYEGFAPSKVPIIVECLTDNRNRTAPEIRQLFKLGQFGGPGSVAFLFDRWGVVEAHHADKSQDIEGAAIEAGAQEVQLVTD